MIDALYVGATGMAAQQTSLETVANNLANMNTPAFKRSQVVFDDLMYREAAQQTPAQGEPAGMVRIGLGARMSSVNKVFTQGELRASESEFDVAINGDGFVPVSNPDGSLSYSRLGSLRVGEDGLLSLRNGLPLDPPITIPRDAKSLQVGETGKVSVLTADGQSLEVGQIELAMFGNPSGLKPAGEGLYQATEQSGEAQLDRAGADGRGKLAQKYLEGSNVKMADELVSLMLAQRAFEANSKIIQAADEMQSISNNLRRS
ncbi:flagellar basal-body rod protein FlgG [Chromobacterium sphagni]|uniref:Flagellar basal-body rod protein FlgG n=1 Tax=Chromobacterium sphagni TaxID=1903179 RepID=A0A1S1WXQ8_9NEIS|nr:flagellar basal-body rod protein FlgG [Chromobacterium sphagni]OHX12073.1 flagellar basal-body rod protein FlgG [Chromobacterium sphagni]